jgi:hypothetical protein
MMKVIFGKQDTASDQKSLSEKLSTWLALDTLKRNPKSLRPASFLSLSLLGFPGLGFAFALWQLRDHSRFDWLENPSAYPWQLWAIAFFGVIATIGGAGDWLFHKIYVTVGPKEHHSHIFALGAGGIVFVLMAIASVLPQPAQLLIPIIITLLFTVTLICYDEFAFHIYRCTRFEDALHRMLVFGNGAAFLCWMHWLFVSGAAS